MAHSNTVNLNYESCKSLALSTFAARSQENHRLILNSFKVKYEGEINSPRTYDRINDLQTLLKVLEKRSALTPSNISVLEYIYGVLNIKTKNLEFHKTLIMGTPTQNIRGEDVENQAPPSNPSFHYRKPNTPDSVPFQRVNSSRHRLSERGGESSTSGNASGSVLPDPPEHADGEVFPIPLLSLLNETLDRVCTGDGTTLTKNSETSNPRHQNYPNELLLDKAVLILMILSLIAWTLYKTYEIIPILYWNLFAFLLVWGLVFSFLKISFGIIMLGLSVYKSLLWFAKNINKQGVKPTVIYCVLALYKDINSRFLHRNDIKEEEPVPNLLDTEVISTAVTVFRCVVWLTRSFHQRGISLTTQDCVVKLVQQIKIEIDYWIEPELESSTPVQSSENQSVKVRYISNLASKLSKSINNLKWFFICAMFYYTMFLLCYGRLIILFSS